MPVFFILVILGTIVLWFLLSSIFIPVGNKIWSIIHEAEEAMSKDKENEKYTIDKDGNVTFSDENKKGESQ